MLRILAGNLAAQQVDAVVSSDDAWLSMGGDRVRHGVSGALANAAGEEMVAEARKFVPVQPGRIIATSGGRLPARFIFHGHHVGGGKSVPTEPRPDSGNPQRQPAPRRDAAGPIDRVPALGNRRSGTLACGLPRCDLPIPCPGLAPPGNSGPGGAGSSSGPGKVGRAVPRAGRSRLSTCLPRLPGCQQGITAPARFCRSVSPCLAACSPPASGGRRRFRRGGVSRRFGVSRGRLRRVGPDGDRIRFVRRESR